MKIYYKKEIEIKNFKKLNFLEKGVGLMFKKNPRILLFEFKKSKNRSIHSFFVFHSFLALWLNKKNEVVEFKIIKPFQFSVKPKKPFFKLVEIPLKKENSKLITAIVGKESFKY